MNIVAVFALILIRSAQSTSENLARLTFTNSKGKHYSQDVPYHLISEKTQYGISYGINMFRIKFKECDPVFPIELAEYFAVFVTVPLNCQPELIFQELITHGPSFIFLDLTQIAKEKKKETPKKISIPLFLVEESYFESTFFPAEKDTKLFVDIIFLMVV